MRLGGAGQGEGRPVDPVNRRGCSIPTRNSCSIPRVKPGRADAQPLVLDPVTRRGVRDHQELVDSNEVIGSSSAANLVLFPATAGATFIAPSTSIFLDRTPWRWRRNRVVRNRMGGIRSPSMLHRGKHLLVAANHRRDDGAYKFLKLAVIHLQGRLHVVQKLISLLLRGYCQVPAQLAQ